MAETPKFDVSKLSEAELGQIQNELVKAAAMRARNEFDDEHDSHSSSHSKNAISEERSSKLH